MSTAVLLAVLITVVFDPTEPVPSVAAVAMFAVQLIVCLPRTRRLRRWWWLPVQAALFPWAGIGGPALLGATALLVVRHRFLRWALFATVLTITWFSALDPDHLFEAVLASGNAIGQGMLIFGLTQLTDLHTELRAARRELAEHRVAGERAHAARELDAVLGTSLSAIIDRAARGRPEEIRTTARAAAARIRAVALRGGEPIPQADLTPRILWPILVLGIGQQVAVGVVYLVSVGPPAPWFIAYALILVATMVLQVHHWLPREEGARPPFAAWTLTAQALLAVGILFAPDRPYPQLVGFAAASAVTLLGIRRGLPLALGFVALTGVVLSYRGASAMTTVFWSINAVSIGVMFFGLGLLTELVYRVQESRQALAEYAAAKERRRIEGDVHDLLGRGLHAIALKADVASSDPVRANAELADIGALARTALSDLRAIPADQSPDLRLATELPHAVEILTAAGARVRTNLEPLTLDIPAGTDALLARVLREAATNVVRHARADHCGITIHAAGDAVRLEVRNDGALPTPGPPGQGLANLRRRVAAYAGRLTAGPDEDDDASSYRLLVELQPSRVGGDPDRVDAVPGVQLGDDRAQVVPNGPVGQVEP